VILCCGVVHLLGPFEGCPDCLDLLRVPAWMNGKDEEHLVGIDRSGDEGVVREPGAKISLLPGHPIQRARSRGGEGGDSVVQVEIAATRPGDGGRFNMPGSIDSSFADHALAGRVGRSGRRGPGRHQSGEERLLRDHDMFDELEDRPSRRHRFPDGHLLVDSRQGFGESLPALIQPIQNFLLLRLTHLFGILAGAVPGRPQVAAGGRRIVSGSTGREM